MNPLLNTREWYIDGNIGWCLLADKNTLLQFDLKSKEIRYVYDVTLPKNVNINRIVKIEDHTYFFPFQGNMFFDFSLSKKNLKSAVVSKYKDLGICCVFAFEKKIFAVANACGCILEISSEDITEFKILQVGSGYKFANGTHLVGDKLYISTGTNTEIVCFDLREKTIKYLKINGTKEKICNFVLIKDVLVASGDRTANLYVCKRINDEFYVEKELICTEECWEGPHSFITKMLAIDNSIACIIPSIDNHIYFYNINNEKLEILEIPKTKVTKSNNFVVKWPMVLRPLYSYQNRLGIRSATSCEVYEVDMITKKMSIIEYSYNKEIEYLVFGNGEYHECKMNSLEWFLDVVTHS